MLWWTGPPVASRAQDVPNDVREITALSFDPVNGGGSAKAQVRGCSRRFADRRPSRWASEESSIDHATQTAVHHPRLARCCCAPRSLRVAPYEGWPVCGMMTNGLNILGFVCGLSL